MSDSLHAYYTEKRDQIMRDARALRDFIAADLVKDPAEATAYVSKLVNIARNRNHLAIEMRRYEQRPVEICHIPEGR